MVLGILPNKKMGVTTPCLIVLKIIPVGMVKQISLLIKYKHKIYGGGF